MSDIICVTNRKLCSGDLLTQIARLAKAAPRAIILREKDMPEEEYRELAGKALAICENAGVSLILHSFTDTAISLGCYDIHLPLPMLRGLTEEKKKSFLRLGTSVHSIEEAKEAQELGCTYITAGHVFETDCKRGLPGRGLVFLKNVCDSTELPVYAIGGITPDNIKSVRACGVAGACIMSSAMICREASELLGEFL